MAEKNIKGDLIDLFYPKPWSHVKTNDKNELMLSRIIGKETDIDS